MGTTALLLFVCMSAVMRGGAASTRQLQATRGGVSSDTAVDPEVYMDSVCNGHCTSTVDRSKHSRTNLKWPLETLTNYIYVCVCVQHVWGDRWLVMNQ